MKILFHIPHIGNGGAERVTSVLINELSGRGYDVHLLIFYDHPNRYELNDNVTVHYLPDPRPFGKSKLKFNWEMLCYYRRLRGLIKEIHPDVCIGVLAESFHRLWISTIGLHIPIIAADHTNFRWHNTKFKKFIRERLYRRADRVIVLTNNDKEYMKDRLNNIEVIHNPLSYPILDHPVEREKNVICVGRLSVWKIKGFDNMLKIWSNVVKTHPEWRLFFAGDGSIKDLEYIQTLAREEGVEDSIDFLGFRRDLQDVLDNCSVFALSSREEGFPCCLTEAMSRGCAPVAFEIHGNIKEIITDKEDGFLIPDGDLKSFQEKLELLMDNEELRSAMSYKAMKSMERFTPDKIGDQWEEMLLNLVKK